MRVRVCVRVCVPRAHTSTRTRGRARSHTHLGRARAEDPLVQLAVAGDVRGAYLDARLGHHEHALAPGGQRLQRVQHVVTGDHLAEHLRESGARRARARV